MFGRIWSMAAQTPDNLMHYEIQACQGLSTCRLAYEGMLDCSCGSDLAEQFTTASKTRQMMNHLLAKRSFEILGNGDDLCFYMDPKQLGCSQKLE
jgi:hypothetical protein